MNTCSYITGFCFLFFFVFFFQIYVLRYVLTVGTAGFYEGQYNYPVILHPTEGNDHC